MARVDFATLVFEGARFDEARMPLDVLPELAAYRSVVLSVAKALFQTRNPNRQRVPKGFESNFQLFLDTVGEGSAVPQISRAVIDSNLFADIFDEARDIVEEGIDAASTGAQMPSALSNEVLSRFALFGKTLLPLERVIVAKPGTRSGATYNRDVRQKLLKMSHMSYEDNVDLLGEVREADKDNSAFAFTTREGMRIPVSSTPLFFTVATRHFYQGDVVRLRGIGVYDANGVLQRITETTDLSESEEGDPHPIGCPTSVKEQIASLERLDEGWLDDTASKYDTNSLVWLERFLADCIANFDLVTPYIYPSPEGFVRAEWSSFAVEVIAKIDVVQHRAEMIAAHDIDIMLEEEIDLDESESAQEFSQFVTRALSDSADAWYKTSQNRA